jgi:mRNA-degrading endonuclease RelE of RelBE toxin-antitoxin system
MRLLFTKPFIRDYSRLPQQIQKRVDKQLGLLLKDHCHPSLKAKKMQDPRNIWEARVTQAYRFTFQLQGDVYILRKVGTHDMLKNP